MFFAILWGVVGFWGCTGDTGLDPAQFVPVQGTLLVNGKPASGVGLIFSPLGEQPEARGFTDEQGHFELKYRGEIPGAAPGEYEVRFGVESADGPTAFIPQKYLNGTSRVTVQVPPGGLTDYKLELVGK